MRIIIGLGGNVGAVRAAFEGAVEALRENDGLEIISRSSLYRTAPVGPEQPDYLNAAILVAADFCPRDLLSLCHRIEANDGRDRSKEQRWGPRTLDIDLLISDSVVCRGPALELPHPRLSERAFALIPTAELAPEWIHPLEGQTLAVLAGKAAEGNPNAVERIGDW